MTAGNRQVILRRKMQRPDEDASQSLGDHPALPPSPRLRSCSSFNSQENQEFRATCLVDEEEMKKLLRERGHMLENHVERLWAYLTIQELLAKR